LSRAVSAMVWRRYRDSKIFMGDLPATPESIHEVKFVNCITGFWIPEFGYRKRISRIGFSEFGFTILVSRIGFHDAGFALTRPPTHSL
jgi:hypothetical protein